MTKTKRPQPRPMATQDEVAAFLQVTVSRLRRWRADGNGPRWVRVGRDVRYLWSDVEAFLAKGMSR